MVLILLGGQPNSVSPAGESSATLGSQAHLVRATTRMVIALVAVLLLIITGAAFIRGAARPTGGRTGSRLEVLDCCALAPKRALYSVRAGSRVVVLGVTDTSIMPVLELTPEERAELYPDSAAPLRSPTFKSLLQEMTTRIGGR